MSAFVAEVAAMREAQRDYYRNPTQDKLRYAKALERKIDRLLAERQSAAQQPRLFD